MPYRLTAVCTSLASQSETRAAGPERRRERLSPARRGVRSLPAGFSAGVSLFFFSFLLPFLLLSPAYAQSPQLIALKATHLIDGKSSTVLNNAVILVEGAKIKLV